jgi:hypothetical protein
VRACEEASTCVFVWMCVCVCVCLSVCLYTDTCICIYIYNIYMDIYIYIYIHINMYGYIYIHIHSAPHALMRTEISKEKKGGGRERGYIERSTSVRVKSQTVCLDKHR